MRPTDGDKSRMRRSAFMCSFYKFTKIYFRNDKAVADSRNKLDKKIIGGVLVLLRKDKVDSN